MSKRGLSVPFQFALPQTFQTHFLRFMVCLLMRIYRIPKNKRQQKVIEKEREKIESNFKENNQKIDFLNLIKFHSETEVEQYDKECIFDKKELMFNDEVPSESTKKADSIEYD